MLTHIIARSEKEMQTPPTDYLENKENENIIQ